MLFSVSYLQLDVVGCPLTALVTSDVKMYNFSEEENVNQALKFISCPLENTGVSVGAFNKQMSLCF